MISRVDGTVAFISFFHVEIDPPKKGFSRRYGIGVALVVCEDRRQQDQNRDGGEDGKNREKREQGINKEKKDSI